MPERSVFVRTRVQGVDEATRELRKLGTEGERASKRIEESSAPASKGLLAVDAAMREGRQSAERYASHAGPLGSILSRLGPAGFAAAAGIGALTIGLTSATRAAREHIRDLNALDDTARKLNLGVQSLQELRFAFQQNGVEARTLETGLQRLERRMGEIATFGRGEAKPAFDALGISVRNAEGRLKTIDEILPELADGLAGITDQGRRLSIIMKLVDTEGVPMINTLGLGAEALEELRRQARDTGAVIDEDVVRRATETNNQLNAMAQVINANLATSLIELSPLLIGTSELFVAITSAARDFGQSIVGLFGSGDENIFAQAIERNRAEIQSLRETLSSGIDAPFLSDTVVAQTKARIAELEAQIERFRSILDGEDGGDGGGAGLDALIQRLAIVRQEVDKAATEQEKLAERTAAVNEALKAGLIDEAEHVRLLGLIADASAKATGEKQKQEAAERRFQTALRSALLEGQREDKRREDARKSIDAMIATMRAERKEIDLTARGRAIAVTLREAENKAIAAGIVLTEEQAEAIREERGALFDRQKLEERRTAVARAAAEERKRIAEEEAEAFQRPFLNAIDGIQDAMQGAFENAFDGSIDSAEEAADAIKSVFIRLASEVATLLVFRPVIGQTLGLIGLGGLAGQLGAGADLGIGAAGAAATAAAGGFPVQALSVGSTAASLFGGELGIAGAINALGANIGFANVGPGFVGPLAAGQTAGLTLSSALGFAGLGGLGASLLGLGSGNLFVDTGTGLGGGLLGGLAGSQLGILGAFGGPIGAIAGGFLGTLLGGKLFGGSAKVPGAGVALTGGVGEPVRIQGHSSTGGDLASVFGLGGAIVDALNLLRERIGDVPAGGFSVQNIGGQLRAGLNAEIIATGSPQAVAEGLIARVLQRAVASPTAGARLFPALSEFISSGPSNFDDLIEGIDALLTRQDELIRLFDDAQTAVFDLGSAIEREATQFGQQTLATIVNLREEAADFGIDAQKVETGLENAVRALIGAEQPLNDELSETEIALERVRARFAALEPVVENVGLSTELLAEGLANAETAIREQFIATIETRLLGFTDPALAALRAIEDAQADRIRAAEALGVELVEIERLNALERAQALDQALGGGISRLRDFRTELALSDLSPLAPAERLAVARAEFEATRISALAGESEAIGAFPGIAQAFLRESRDFSASGPGFAADFRSVNQALDQVLAIQDATANGFEGLAFTVTEATEAQTAALARRLDQLVSEIQDVRRELARLADAA